MPVLTRVSLTVNIPSAKVQAFQEQVTDVWLLHSWIAMIPILAAQADAKTNQRLAVAVSLWKTITRTAYLARMLTSSPVQAFLAYSGRTGENMVTRLRRWSWLVKLPESILNPKFPKSLPKTRVTTKQLSPVQRVLSVC